MPSSYKIDKRRRFVLSTVTGELSYAELVAHQRDLSEDRDFDPSFAHIVDFTYGTLAKISAEEVRQFAERSIFTPDARRAVIVANLADYGMARMYEMLQGLKGLTGIRAFRTLEEALDWIEGAPLSSDAP